MIFNQSRSQRVPHETAPQFKLRSVENSCVSKFIIFFEAYLGPELQRELCRSHLIAKTVNFLSARFMYDSSCIPQSSENWACSEEALNKY